jgi:hypothetical protein
MNRYKPIILVGILVAFVRVGLAIYEQLTAATRDKNEHKSAEKDKEVENLKAQVSSMQSAQKEILELLKDPDRLLAVLKQDK